jgi:hypothetical protein
LVPKIAAASSANTSVLESPSRPHRESGARHEDFIKIASGLLRKRSQSRGCVSRSKSQAVLVKPTGEDRLDSRQLVVGAELDQAFRAGLTVAVV